MTLEDGRHWWNQVPDLAKNITYMSGAIAGIMFLWTLLGLPVLAFRTDITTAIIAQASETDRKLASHAADDQKMFAALSEASNTARKTAETATERAINSLLQNSYTRRDFIRAEMYRIETNKTPPGNEEEARIAAIHRQQVTDSLRQVSRDICQLTNKQECDQSP